MQNSAHRAPVYDSLHDEATAIVGESRELLADGEKTVSRVTTRSWHGRFVTAEQPLYHLAPGQEVVLRGGRTGQESGKVRRVELHWADGIPTLAIAIERERGGDIERERGGDHSTADEPNDARPCLELLPQNEHEDVEIFSGPSESFVGNLIRSSYVDETASVSESLSDTWKETFSDGPSAPRSFGELEPDPISSDPVPAVSEAAARPTPQAQPIFQPIKVEALSWNFNPDESSASFANQLEDEAPTHKIIATLATLARSSKVLLRRILPNMNRSMGLTKRSVGRMSAFVSTLWFRASEAVSVKLKANSVRRAKPALRRVTSAAPHKGLQGTVHSRAVDTKAIHTRRLTPGDKRLLLAAIAALAGVVAVYFISRPVEPPPSLNAQHNPLEAPQTALQQPATANDLQALPTETPNTMERPSAVLPSAPTPDPEWPEAQTLPEPSFEEGQLSSQGLPAPPPAIQVERPHRPLAKTVKSAAVSVTSKATPVAPSSKAIFGSKSIKNGQTFTLRLSKPVTSIQGKAEQNGFVVHVPNALSLDRASPIKASAQSVELARMLNKGDHSELTIRFKENAKATKYRVVASGDKLEITLGK